jgi:light-regulated signal transduction histidine kinase (bacteriophytochrome)
LDYLAAAFIAAGAVAVSIWAEGLLEPNLAVPYFAAVALAAWLGGLRPALLAIGIATGGFWYTHVRPSGINEAARVLAFAGVTLLTAWLIHLIQRSREELARSEARLRRLSEELERSNAELEQFAYEASHDLQEPLRMVASYTALLGETYKGKLGPDADKYIGYAVDGARRMQALINDLLQYSRVGRKQGALAAVSMNAAFEQALVNLQAAIWDSAATVTRDDLPSVRGDQVLLTQVFQNLVGNAVKFRGTAPPAVHVSAVRSGSEWVFSVRDNGIGFDPRYAERIFVLFQRLHGRDRYQGTGIGLAVCKKVIERHGGRIWAESKPGQGSTFSFTIPVSSEVKGELKPGH